MSNNIYWKVAVEIADRIPITLRNNLYLCGGRVCYWTGNEKMEAHAALDLAVSQGKQRGKPILR